MNIKEAKEQIKNAVVAYFSKDEFGDYIIPIERQRPVFLIGAPGIGKTAIMEQIAQELDVGLVSYSMTHHTRQSALGLPFIEKHSYKGEEFSISEYTMSEIIASVYNLMEKSGHEEGILFLDEINCVSETLAPAMLQFLQYKVFGMHKIPAGWIVVTAGNPPEYNKSVREYDIVTWDRLKRIDVEPDYEVWKEYAEKKCLHGSILTFLELKKNYFYVIEAAVDRKSFVTARGWEDLSEMIKLYEMHNIKVDLKLVSQYLQNETIAKEFSLYYDLYNKYKSSYQIPDILKGEATDVVISQAKAAQFDEKLALIGLLLDAVNADMRNVVEQESAIRESLRILKLVKQGVNDGDDCLKLLHQYCDEEADRLKKGEIANSISYETSYSYKSTIQFLNELMNIIKSSDTRDSDENFELVKGEFNQRVSEHKNTIKKVQKKLDNLFIFMENTFGEGQELTLLVTELTVRYHCAKFISQFGCERYFQHNSSLLFHERRKELIDEIDELEK